MKTMSVASRTVTLVVASILLFAVTACGDEIRVMTSGARSLDGQRAGLHSESASAW